MCESNVLQRKVQPIRRFHSFSSLHYDKAVIARMTSVDKTSTHASNEGVKLAARFVLVRFHASPGIIILKLCWGGPIMYAWEFNGTVWGFVFNRVTYLSFQSSAMLASVQHLVQADTAGARQVLSPPSRMEPTQDTKVCC